MKAMDPEAYWRRASFIGLAIVAVFGFSTIILPNACPVADALLTDDQIERSLHPNCVEFWFNRYQTVFGVLVAVGVGWQTWRTAQRQVLAADQQRAVSLIPVISSRLESARSILWAANGAKRTVNRLNSNIEDIAKTANEISSMQDENDKQKHYEEIYLNKAQTYIEDLETLHKRISYIRTNIKPALLGFSTSRCVEDYLSVLRPINKAHSSMANRVRFTIEAKSWRVFDVYAKRISKSISATIGETDLAQHSVHAGLNGAVTELEVLLDQVLDASHNIRLKSTARS